MNILKMNLLPHMSSLAFQNNCGYAFTKHRYPEEGYGSMSQFSFMSVPFLLRVPNAPGNEGFSLWFPKVTSYHRNNVF